MEPTPISRREAMKLLLGVVGATSLALAPSTPVLAISQDDINKTEAELAEAQSKLDEVQGQLDEIATQYEALSQSLAQTLADIDGVNAQIADTEAQIAEKEAELTEKRERLANRVRSAYKSGGDEALSAILLATSFEELSSNIYYLDKISDNDRRLIEDVESLKVQLEEQKAQLEEQKAQLEELRATQESQLSEMQAKQEEVQQILNGLDENVQALMAKRDEELLQLSREREEQKKREQEALAAQSTGSRAGNVTGDYADGSTSGSQARVIAACKSTGSPGSGLCAMWVSMVFSNAGFAYAGGNANDMYNWWTTSSNRADLKPGMIVAVSTHSHTSAGRIYGHIGIYIGNGIMMDNIGYIRTISVNEWVNFYSTTVTPRWGWLMGIPLAE
ncbi:MAG: hypothetical protein IKG11_04955 [Atopobiaceae bacterium]|nr:hypothetical protein [Atopobiaceae bacterium]